MAAYEIRWKPSAVRELRKLDHDAIPRIVAAVEGLSDDPFPEGARKLRGPTGSFRIRVGDYRIIYSVVPARRLVEVGRVRHRRDAYRR